MVSVDIVKHSVLELESIELKLHFRVRVEHNNVDFLQTSKRERCFARIASACNDYVIENHVGILALQWSIPSCGVFEYTTNFRVALL